MKRFFVTKDNEVISSSATREDAMHLIRVYQEQERDLILRSNYSIIEGKEEYIPYKQ